MQETFILFLSALHDMHASWVVLNADGSVREVSREDQPDGLAAIAEDKKVIVMVPSSAVLLTSVLLPKMNRTRLMQALPYALEEQVIDDVEALHFAMQPDEAHQPIAVAIVSTEKMTAWLALLSSWQITPDVMTVTALALPLDKTTWHIGVMATDAMVRTDLNAGFNADLANLSRYLDIALQSTNAPPAQLKIYNTTNQSFKSIVPLSLPYEEQYVSHEDFLSLLAKSLMSDRMINLLQGKYTVKKPRRLPQVGKVWRWASYLMMGWVALLFLYPLIAISILSARLDTIEADINAIYHRHFPKAEAVVAPKLRLQDKLEKLSAEIGENRLLVLLATIGRALEATSHIKLQRLEFQGNQLTLALTAATSDDVSAFTNDLTRQGLTVKQQNATLNGARISATLQIN